MAGKKHFYSADEAIGLLGVTKGTLYSYVSRGLIHSEEVGGKTRERRYLVKDVDALIERKRQRKNPERVAKAALSWGAPVLESALTSIEGGTIYYRGEDATILATERTFEDVANWLWLAKWHPDDRAGMTGELAGEATSHAAQSKDVAGCKALWEKAGAAVAVDTLQSQNLKPIEIFQAILPIIGALDWGAYHLETEVVVRTARHIIQAMSNLATLQRGASGAVGEYREMAVAHALQQAWLPENPDARALIDAALILCADHELNVSSFTVRCVASAGSTPYAAVLAGLSALQGFRHGGQSELVELLFRDIASMLGTHSQTKTSVNMAVQAVIASRLKRGEAIPGFGHPLYPEMDPRCDLLLNLAQKFSLGQGSQGQNSVGQDSPGAMTLEIADTIVDVVSEHIGKAPNLDFGLVVLSQVLGLPEGTPLVLFALGRTAGWIGHYIEQVEIGQLIRPRATYVGKRQS